MDRYSNLWYNALAQRAVEKNIAFLLRKMKRPIDGFKIKVPKKSYLRLGKKTKLGKSGIPGIVNASKHHKKPWQARSPLDKKYLGCFENVEDAQKAQNDYALKLKAA